MLNPTLSDLIGGIQSVALPDEGPRRRGTQKSILERKPPPTFDVVVEIQSWDQVAVHSDVATTVDSILRGRAIAAQIRSINDSGEIRTEEAVPRLAVPAPERPVAASARPAPPPTKLIRIYSYGASHNRLEEAAREVRLSGEITQP